MRTTGTWDRLRTGLTMAVAAAFLGLPRQPAAAQQTANAVSQDSTPLTLLLIVFPDTTAAQTAAANLGAGMSPAQGYEAPKNENGQPADTGQPAAKVSPQVTWVEPYYAVATADRSGKVNVQDYGNKGTSARDTRAVQSIDGVGAMLGEKPSAKNQQAAGAGASKAGISSSDLKQMQGALDPGEAGLIIVVAAPEASDVSNQMKQAHASDVYSAPLVVVPQ
jgi:hypothetical protein